MANRLLVWIAVLPLLVPSGICWCSLLPGGGISASAAEPERLAAGNHPRHPHSHHHDWHHHGDAHQHAPPTPSLPTPAPCPANDHDERCPNARPEMPLRPAEPPSLMDTSAPLDFHFAALADAVFGESFWTVCRSPRFTSAGPPLYLTLRTFLN